MAGRGPVPKRPEQRRRANPPVGGEWRTLPAEGRKGRTPALRAKVSKATRAWWRRIWRSPMATQWAPDDVEALTELAVLRDKLLEDGTLSVASEVRLRSDHFGLTPKGRQERRWIIAGGEVERPVTPPGDELEGRRARLEALSAEFESEA